MSKAETISGEELEALTGLTDRRHRQLAKEGYFDPPVRGQYKFHPALRGLFKYFREDRNKATMELSGERLRKLSEEADRIALDNAKFREQLVDEADFLKRWEPIYTAMRQKITGSGLKDHEKDSLLGELSKLHEI